MPAVAVSLLLGCVPLSVPLLLWWRTAPPRSVRLRWLLLQMSAGAIVAAFIIYARRVAVALFGWSHVVLGRGQRLEGLRGVLLGALPQTKRASAAGGALVRKDVRCLRSTTHRNIFSACH